MILSQYRFYDNGGWGNGESDQRLRERNRTEKRYLKGSWDVMKSRVREHGTIVVSLGARSGMGSWYNSRDLVIDFFLLYSLVFHVTRQR